jgi:hypothetical protein
MQIDTIAVPGEIDNPRNIVVREQLGGQLSQY